MAGERYEEFRDLALRELSKAEETNNEWAAVYIARGAVYAELAKAEALKQAADQDPRAR